MLSPGIVLLHRVLVGGHHVHKMPELQRADVVGDHGIRQAAVTWQNKHEHKADGRDRRGQAYGKPQARQPPPTGRVWGGALLPESSSA